jgi:hypothetical protein
MHREVAGNFKDSQESGVGGRKSARKSLRIFDRINHAKLVAGKISRISMDWPEASPCGCLCLTAKVRIYTAKQLITFCPAIRSGQNFIS